MGYQVFSNMSDIPLEYKQRFRLTKTYPRGSRIWTDGLVLGIRIPSKCHFQTYHNTLFRSFKILHKRCFQFVLTCLDQNKWYAVCLSKNPNNFVISYSIALKLCEFIRNLSRNNTHVNMWMYCSLALRGFTVIEHHIFDKIAILTKLSAKISCPCNL